MTLTHADIPCLSEGHYRILYDVHERRAKMVDEVLWSALPKLLEDLGQLADNKEETWEWGENECEHKESLMAGGTSTCAVVQMTIEVTKNMKSNLCDYHPRMGNMINIEPFTRPHNCCPYVILCVQCAPGNAESVMIFLLFHNLFLLIFSHRIHVFFGMCRYDYVSLLLIVHPFRSHMLIL